MIFSNRKKTDYITPKIPPLARSGIYGHVDTCSIDGITGWVIDLDQPSTPQVVQLYLNGNKISETICSYTRADIANIIGFTSECGFIMPWNNCINADIIDLVNNGKNCSIEIKLAKNGKNISSEISDVKSDDIQKWINSCARNASVENIRCNSDISITPSIIEQQIKEIPGQQIEPVAREGDVKLIAYYLPQFHPILENDEWWGPGFTEWTNVAQAVPSFKGHYQPHVPGELGFYDLRLPEVRESQARLAREHGIYGFCYYYYWFSGRRLLERPLQEVFESGEPDFPFCICWANENWSRRWDGSEQEILVAQEHNEKTDEAFIYDVIPLFKDPRYIKLNGAPLLIVYRISLMPNPLKTAETWRSICCSEGIPQIHLCMAETFGISGPYQYGFDSAVQFPPHGVSAREENSHIEDLPRDFTGKIYDMKNVVQDQLVRDVPTYKRFPGVMTAWDNTARKKKTAHIFLNSSPFTYELWLRGAIDQARKTLPSGEKLVFINAWNEWAEGAHLEPDRMNGRAYLEATLRALTGQTDWKTLLDYAEGLTNISGEVKRNLLSEIRQALERQSLVNHRLLQIMGDNGLPKQWSIAKPGTPFWFKDALVIKDGHGKIDQINHYYNIKNKTVVVDNLQKMYLYGWSFSSQVYLEVTSPTYLIFTNKEKKNLIYYSIVPGRWERVDVAKHFHKIKHACTLFSGIKIAIDISVIEPGLYEIEVASRSNNAIVLTKFETEIEIV